MKKLIIPCILFSFSSFAYTNDIMLQAKLITDLTSPVPKNITKPLLVATSERSAFYWIRSPKPIYFNGDLEGKSRNAEITFETDKTGKIISAKVIKSSGVKNLDNILLNSLYRARTSIYKENGIAFSVRAVQPFEIILNDTSSTKKSKLVTVKPPQKTCIFKLDTEIYKLQNIQEKTPFYYVNAPVFYIYESEVKSEKPSIEFAFHLSRNDIISNLKITKSSGSDDIDARFLFAMRNVKIQAPRKFFQLHTFQFKDEIKLNPEKQKCITTYVN